MIGADRVPPRHHPRSFAWRSRPARTFRGLAGFAALLFVSSGIFMIARPMLDPVAEQDVGVVAGASAIAVGSTLLFYLVKPAPGQREARTEPRKELRSDGENLVLQKKPALEPAAFKPPQLQTASGIGNYARGIAGKYRSMRTLR